MNAARVAERVARESYGRLLAQLVHRTRDVAAAEDALSEAFAAALSAWPKTGAPANPEGWLFAAAKRKLVDASRRAKTAREGESEIARAAEEIEAEMAKADLPDRRLGLLFACAHRDVEPAARTPLMLQTVLGLSAERIAVAYLVEPAAMGQRLLRAKRKIREAGMNFDIPGPDEWRERLAAVLDAIYAAYAEGWSDPEGEDPARRDLAEEGLWLARVLWAQLPDEPEAAALLALMLVLESRRAARRTREGDYVPLGEQDTRLWRRDFVEEAIALMAHLAPQAARAERYQIEAAIQHAHLARYFSLPVAWETIASLYGRLAALTDSPAAKLNAIAAGAHIDGPASALEALDALAGDEKTLGVYQPYWALRADLCAKAGRPGDARAAYGEAIARARDPAIVRFLQARRGGL